jgi:hypothetical protein
MSILTSILSATVGGALVGLIVGSASGVRKGMMVFYISLLSVAALIAFVIYMQTQTRTWMIVSAASIYGIIQIVRATKHPTLANPPPLAVHSASESTPGAANPPELPGSLVQPTALNGRPALPVTPTRRPSAFGTASKIFVGLFATPIVFMISGEMLEEFIFSGPGEEPIVIVLAFCLVGLVWVGIIAWIKTGIRRRS